MKILSRFFLTALVLCGAVTSCLKYDDAAIRHEISELDKRIKELENIVNTYNDNIQSVQALVDGAKGYVFVKKVTEIGDGYIITFSDGSDVTIKNGADGADGATPAIGVRQDSDGVWYWTLNGEWLLGPDQNKMRVTGENGADGKDSIAPMLKIENEYWYMSVDGGKTWEKMIKATGEDGAPGANGGLFEKVEVNDSFVYFKLKDGNEFTLGRGAGGVQAISVIPDYGDGTVEGKAGEFKMRFEVVPASAAASLGMLPDKCFSVTAFHAQTKAYIGGPINIPIVDRYVFDGILYLTVNGRALGQEFTNHNVGASASLTIDDGCNAITSGYFPLYEDGGRKNGHAYVDLGLSVLWATSNMGATLPQSNGDFYAWGETAPKGSFAWENYRWSDPPTKYKDDGIDRLAESDDAAFISWGRPWRMPTKAEMDELLSTDNCTWSWTPSNGVNGYLVVSKKPGYEGNSIFLPAAGTSWNSAGVLEVGSMGYYWSATANLSEPHDAFIIHIAQNFPRVVSNNRGAGCSIRPVCDK